MIPAETKQAVLACIRALGVDALISTATIGRVGLIGPADCLRYAQQLEANGILSREQRGLYRIRKLPAGEVGDDQG